MLREGLDRLLEQGVKRVLAVPAMLFAAGHAKNDIPSVLNNYAAEKGLIIDYGRELGINDLMIGAAGARSVPGCLARRAHVVRSASSLVRNVAINMAVSDVSAAAFF